MARQSQQQGRLVKAKTQCRLGTAKSQWFVHLSIYSIVSLTRLVKAINLVVYSQSIQFPWPVKAEQQVW